MYQTSLYFDIKDPNAANQKILEMFFEAWVDETCDNNVEYSFIRNAPKDILRVDFSYTEDAIAIKLKGIPDEFQNYLSLSTRLS